MSGPVGAMFVGRDRELSELVDALDHAAAGHGRLFLIAGEPGIGKSRLADELVSAARQRDMGVLWGRGWEDAGAPPYWPWVQALRAHLRSVPSAEVRRQLGGGAGDVAQMLPELREMFPDLPPPPDQRSESARFQLFDSTATLLRNAANSGPMVLVLDDLHAADTPSLLLLRFVASQLGDMRLLLIASYRDVALTPDHPLTATVAELQREPVARLLNLTGLAPRAVGELIAATAGLAPHEQLVAAVWRETNGNPLFLGEAIRLLASQGRLRDVSDLPSLRVAVPAGVREVIVRRIGHLGETAAQALAIGAAIGPEFRVEVLRRVARLSADDMLDVLDQAVEEGLLLPVAGSLDRFRFSHDLVREVLYGTMATSRRVRLHRRIVEVLEALHGATIDQHLAELAHHAFEAVRGGEGRAATEGGPPLAEKAIDYARRAGERAARSVAYEEAARLYRMALVVLDMRGAPDEELRLDILLALGQAMARAGDIVASRTTFLKAAEIAKRTGSARQLAHAALGIGGRLPWARPGRDTRLIPLLQDALVMLGGADDRLRVRLLTRLACAWRNSADRREESAALARQAVDLARATDDPETLSYALTGSYWARWWPENPDDRLQIAEEMLVVAEALSDAERLIDAHLMFFVTYAELGRMVEARTKLQDVSRLADDLRQPSQLWLGIAPRTMMALFDGDYDLAERTLARELEQQEPITLASDEKSAAAFHVYLLRREQDRAAEAEPVTRAAVEDFPWYPLHRPALVCLLVAMGRRDEARLLFDELATDRFRALVRDNEWLLGISLAAEACHLLGDEANARVLYEQVAPFAGRHAIGQAEGSVGAVDRYLGLLAMTLGRGSDAERHLTDGLELNQRLGTAPWTAHTQYDLARVLRQLGDDARAAGLLDQALATASRIGMEALGRRIEQLRLPAESAPPRTDRPRAGVFRRDGDYWTVSFDGEAATLRDAKGMRYLARLLSAPGRELHALDLVQGGGMAAPARASAAALTDGVASDPFAGSGPLLDAEAKAAYRARLVELEDERAQAEDWNDVERAARARGEMERLAAELSRAVGLGGRDRDAASGAERARVSVTRAVRLAMSRLEAELPALGAHLRATIRTGTYCSYQPDSRIEARWET